MICVPCLLRSITRLFARSVCLLTLDPAMLSDDVTSRLLSVVAAHGSGFVLSFCDAVMDADIIRVEHAKHGTFLKLFKHPSCPTRKTCEKIRPQYSRDVLLHARAVSTEYADESKECPFKTMDIEPTNLQSGQTQFYDMSLSSSEPDKSECEEKPPLKKEPQLLTDADLQLLKGMFEETRKKTQAMFTQGLDAQVAFDASLPGFRCPSPQ